MARTLEQIDTALAAVEVQLPRVQNGLTTTVQQATLVLESEITALAGGVGVPAAGAAPATGLYGYVASLNTLLADLQAQVAALQAAQSA
jgi:hypothetical protein